MSSPTLWFRRAPNIKQHGSLIDSLAGWSSAEHRSHVNAAQVSEAFERRRGVTWWSHVVDPRWLAEEPHGDDPIWSQFDGSPIITVTGRYGYGMIWTIVNGFHHVLSQQWFCRQKILHQLLAIDQLDPVVISQLSSDIIPPRPEPEWHDWKKSSFVSRVYKGRERKAMSWHRKIMGTMCSTCCEPLDD